MEICSYNYALLASKEWYEWTNKNAKGLLLNIRKARKRVEALRQELQKEHIFSEKDMPGNDRFWSNLLSSLTFPSFVLLFGKGVEDNESIPLTSKSSKIRPYAQRDFEILGENLELPDPAGFARALTDKLPGDGYYIVPPYPTTDLVMGLVEKWFRAKGLNKKYGEYSAFIHSYPDTMIVFPFSSVIEVKAFKYEISRVESIVSKIVKEYKKDIKRIKRIK